MRFFTLLLAAAAGVFPGALRAGPLHLKVDSAASSVTFDVRVNVGLDSFVGKVDNWTLDLTMPAQGDLPDRAIFTVDALGLKTGKDDRDKEMLRWLENEKFPAVRYEMKAIRKSASGGLEADGELSIHGKTQTVTFPLSIERKEATLTVRGGVTVNYTTFDLKIIRKFGFLSVKPEIKIAFLATGTLE